MSFFNRGKPEPKKKYVGLSKKPTIANVVKKVTVPDNTGKTQQKPSLIPRNIFQPLQPYLAVVKEDIKTVLCIDEKRRMKQQEYKDFMEHFFGEKK
jgi:hypothetical protein